MISLSIPPVIISEVQPATGCKKVGKLIICPDFLSNRGSGRKETDVKFKPKSTAIVSYFTPVKFTPIPNPEPVGTGGTGTRRPL